MATAYATTNEIGHLTQMAMTIGTGGHGDTPEIYSKEYSFKDSMITVVDYRVKTGELNLKGNPKYKTYYKKVMRASVLRDVLAIDYLAHKALSELPFTNEKTQVECRDLIDDEGVKVGLSIAIGEYEARIIKGKCQLMSHGKPVRLFKTQ